MFNKRAILSKLANTCLKYEIDRGDIRLDSGGAAVFLNLRDVTADIDVSLESPVFDSIAIKHNIKVITLPPLGSNPAIKYYQLGGVDFHRVEGLRNMDSIFHRGFRIQRHIDLLRFKLSMGREKDFKDISSIINSNPSITNQLTESERVILSTLINHQKYEV